MKWTMLFIFFLSCSPSSPQKIAKGDCVLGIGMDVYQLMQEDDETYLLARVPVQEGSPLEIVKDISTFKKVECPH